jgi:hypothetical protein
MATAKQATNQPASIGKTKTPHASDRLYLENTLLRVAGAVFRHDARRVPNPPREIFITSPSREKTITVRPDPFIGQPGPLAHKLFFALIKKHSDHGLPARGQVSFSKREVMGLIGRKSWGGRDSEQLSRALHEIHHTFVKAQFKGKGGRWIEHSFNIFPEIMLERRAVASDPIEACTVTIAEPILASLRDEHFTCLNHALMATLSTIGQALYVRLFFHFANLYDRTNPVSLAFPKRYDAICAEWLGGLNVRPHRSQIGEQLGPHLRQLVEARFLASFDIAKAKSAPGFVLTFRPGETFFADYARFYRRRRAHGSTAEIGSAETGDDALRVAYLFVSKRSGREVRSIPFVTSKDRETARMLLGHVGATDMPAFFDFALAEARRTRFDIQTIGGVRQYLAGYLALKERRRGASRPAAPVSAQSNPEAIERAGEDAKRAAARRLFDSLPKATQDGIRAEAEAKARKFSGTLRRQMTDFHIARITAERYSGKLAERA